MTDNTLRVKITAQDRAAKVIEDLENRIKRLRPPTMQAAGAMGHVNETTTRLERFAKGRTLPLASEHLRRISRDAFGAFRNIGRLSAEMGGLGEVLAGGTVLGGLAAAAILTKRWADQGMRLGNMSANIGITPGELIRYQRVGALRGVSGDAVAGGLQTLNQDLFQARIGNDPRAVQAFAALGIHAGIHSGHLESATKLLPQIADKIRGMTPQGQQATVQALGLSPDILPLLRMGGKGIELAAAKLKAQGLTTDAYAGSTKLYEDFVKLDNAAIELTNTMARRFEPTLDALVRGLTWLMHDIRVPDAAKITTPRYQRFPGIAAARGVSGDAHPAAPLPPGIGAQVRAQAKLRGLDPAWMTALARQEGGTGKVSSAGAIGTMQLMPGTAAMEGVNPYNQKQNVIGGEGYFQQLLGRYHGNYAVATAAYNAGPANPGVRWFAETGSMSRLPEQTKQYVMSIEGMDKAANARNLSPEVMNTLAGLRAQQGNVTVDINHTNAPPGTTTRATATGAASMGGLRISTAMPNQAYP
ncbi:MULTISPECIES: lytic transglycosylase domain-containing protein [Acidiphilium]|uniref:lytic transglycosylase domain-containing protein n=1 Tax=Acidiphilium TaxID=522 RepID=UPI0025885205|nr:MULTISPECIES: transglycosylase SLT domain-containing protein [Acidiphilium]HQT86356.1 transglycosylase SLT domain-containing protein [Acidiphilium rubrum]